MLALFIAKVRQHRENGHREDEHWLCDHNLLLGALFYPDILAMLVELSERLRLRLPKIKAFRIKEQILCNSSWIRENWHHLRVNAGHYSVVKIRSRLTTPLSID